MAGDREARKFKSWKMQRARIGVIGRHESDGGNGGHNQELAVHGVHPLRLEIIPPLKAPATVTAIQLAQNGTSTPFKVTDYPNTIRINCRSAIRAKMAAASVQKVLTVIARLRSDTRTCSPPAAKNGDGPARRPLPLSREVA
jgi:hypothetical protein